MIFASLVLTYLLKEALHCCTSNPVLSKKLILFPLLSKFYDQPVKAVQDLEMGLSKSTPRVLSA